MTASSSATARAATVPPVEPPRHRFATVDPRKSPRSGGPSRVPMMLGAIAAAGLFNPVAALPLSHPVGWLGSAPLARLSEATLATFPLAGLQACLATVPMWSPAAGRPGIAADRLADPRTSPSRADKLRADPLQRSAVALPPRSDARVPVRLTSEQRAIADHIARSYRVAAESVERFVYYAFKVAREARLDPHLILAVMAVESSFNPQAESVAGAQGLMQVLTRVHKEKFAPFGGTEAVWDPLANIKVGSRILADNLRRHGDLAGALKAYVGAALLDHDGGYGNKVLSRRDEFVGVVSRLSAKAKPASKPIAQAVTTPQQPTAASGVRSSVGL